jgi:multidrug efflux system outer membrane protein
MSKQVFRLGAWTLALVLAGCSLAPRYERPALPVASQYPAGDSAAAKDAVELGWREMFTDARLQALIATALQNNRDLRTAVLNAERAQALYRVQRAGQLPQVDAQGSLTRGRTPAALSPTGSAVTGSEYQVGLGVTAFELDLFGRVRSLKDAALAQYLATAEARDAARIALIAEVAKAWLADLALREQLDLARKTLEARSEAMALARQRYEAGASSALDLKQVETLVESARVATVTLTRRSAQAGNALRLVVGAPVDAGDQASLLSDQQFLANLPAGLPSQLLAQRPDLRAAELRLQSANASIGVARAAFFPRISLTAGIGSASPELSGLFEAGSRNWSFVPQLTLPIFDAGRNRANLRVSQVDRDLAVADYERSIQIAFREVADALVARGSFEEQVEAQERLRQGQADRLQLAEQRYKAGIASYLDVLDAQRELFDAEQGLVEARQQRLLNLVDLYRALGGGLRERGAGA